MSERQYPSTRYSWYMVVILTIAYILSYIDRSILGLLIEPIKADLNLSDTQMGILGGPLFAIFYATMGLPLGVAADKYRRTWIVAAGIFVWSFATAASGLAKNFYHLGLARLGVGIGEATLGPCAMSMISDSFPREKRGRPIAFYTAALSLGAAIASLIGSKVLEWAETAPEIIMPLVGEVAAWQLVFFIVGVPGLFVALILITLREPKRQKTINNTVSPKISDMLKHVGSRWKVYLSFLAFACVMTIVAYSQFFYAPMFERTWGMSASTYAWTNGWILLFVGPVSVNIAGWLNDKMFSTGNADAPLKILIAGVCILVPTGIAIPLMPTAEIAFVLIALNTVGIATASATGVTGLLNITPSEIRGQVVAIYYLAISMSGLFLGPLSVGMLSDHVYGNEHLNYAAATVPAIYGIPVLFLIGYALRQYRAEVKRQEANIG